MTAQRCSLVCISRTRTCGARPFTPASSGIAVPFCQSPAAALRHVAGFPDLGLLRRLRPVPARSADGGPSPAIRVGGAARGRTGTVPVFTDRRLTKEEPGCTPAASPRLRRRLSPWPPGPAVVSSPEVAHPRVRQARTAPSPDPPGSSWWDILGGFTHRFLAYSFSSCSPGPPPSDGAGHAPALSGPLATLTGTSRIGLPSASPACCDRPAVAVSHPHSNNQRLTAHSSVAPAGILAGHS